MSDAPERIWLNLGHEEITYQEAMMGEVSWCEDRQGNWDVEYIRADLIPWEEIEAELERHKEVVAAVGRLMDMDDYPDTTGDLLRKILAAREEGNE